MIKANKKDFLGKNQSDSMLDMISKQGNNDVVKGMLSVIEGVRVGKESLIEYLESLKYDREGVFNDILDELNKQVEMINDKFIENDKTIKTLLTKQDKKEIQGYINNISRLTIKIEYNIQKLSEKKANKSHGHTIGEINGLRDELDSKTRLISEIGESFTVKEKDFKNNFDNLKTNLEFLTESLKKKADIDHKHSEYALKEDLDLLAQRPVHISGGARIDDSQTTPNATWSSEKIQTEINAGGGGASSLEVTQNAHGFINLDWLYFDESDNTFKKAQSNAEATLGARHVVEVVDANTFKVAKDGVHEIANTLDLGEYVLSQDTAGGYTQTLPGDLGDYVLWGMEVVSSTHVSFYTVPAIPVGDTGEGVQSVVAGTGITVDNTDPLNPIINATGGGSGTVTSVAISGSDGLEVDSGSPVTTTGTIALGVNKTAMLSHLNVEDGADVTDATNVAAAGAFMKATDDTDDITEGTTNLFFTSAEQTKLAGIESGAEVNNISDANATDLTDGNDTTLHTHDGRYYTETETDGLLNAKQPDIQFKDEGTNAGTAGGVTIVDFVGAGVTASETGGTLTVTIPGGGGGGGITRNEVTGTSQTAVVNNGYITNNAGLVTVTLPSTASVGATVRIGGKGAGLWRVAQNSGQVIHFGIVDTTTGATGYLEANARYDSVELVCITANTDWLVVSSLGNIDVI